MGLDGTRLVVLKGPTKNVFKQKSLFRNHDLVTQDNQQTFCLSSFM